MSMFGDTYVHLTVVKQLDEAGTRVRCVCICERLLELDLEDLKSGTVISCGCVDEFYEEHMEFVANHSEPEKPKDLTRTQKNVLVKHLGDIMTIEQWSKRLNITCHETREFFNMK